MTILQAKLHSLNPKWIQGVTESPKFRRGALGRKAAKAHMKTKEFMSHVLADPAEYDPTTRRQAQFMKTLLSFKHGQ
jgi:hypothetical protein